MGGSSEGGGPLQGGGRARGADPDVSGLRDGGVLLPGSPGSPARLAFRITALASWILLSVLGVPVAHRPLTTVLVAVAGAVVIVSATVLRRRHWWLSALGVQLFAAMGLVLTAIGPSWVGWAPVVFALFWSIIRLPARFAVFASATLTAGMIVVGWFALGPAAVVGQLGTCMGVAVLAYSMRTARQRATDAERLLASERAAREATERAGVLAERQRLAREIHDILAHTLSAQVVQLEGTRMLLRHGADTDAVLARVEQAQRLARDGLDETRRALDSLRGRSRPLTETLPALAADAGAGYTSEGDARDLGPEASLAIVRTVQEALTNVRKHARGAATTVRLRYAPDATTVEVVDGGGGVPAADELAGTGGGYGLAGMRERAELLGGALTAGPLADGGFRVRLRIPT
ncbi:two-component sensor histidine kinase [Actinocatenispora thailandica]|uniref:histidine kinase n=1 Tax=Actinocatenispora thailandica TaxID=227318 RepID=A0A7R7HXM0_9ACTN|nr:histidine kinase [Actinocatenispora thailandica]BCJ35273.1 two-component sensor histidine kinase [Actinocatenispora thailandica]